MLNFDFYSPTRMVFGKGSVDEVGKHIAPLAKKVLIHYGSERIVTSGLLERITSSLSNAGVSFVALGGVRANPDIELVLEGVKLAKKRSGRAHSLRWWRICHRLWKGHRAGAQKPCA